MKIEIKPPIHELLAQLPTGALMPGDIARLNLTRAFIKAMRAESVAEDLPTNVFHDGAALALADGITDALRDIIKESIPKRDGRRRPVQAAQALSHAQTFQGRIKLLKTVLTGYKKTIAAVPGLAQDARGKLMRPAFAEVTRAFDLLLELAVSSEDMQDTLDDMQALRDKTEETIGMWESYAFDGATKADGPANAPTLARWIMACGTLSTQAAEAIRALKNPG